MDPVTLVPETPVEFDEHTYTARMNANLLRWQVFRDNGLTPVGYLDAVYQPTESANGWQLTVADRSNRPIGELGKRAAAGTVPAVDSYSNALVWLLARERGDA